MRGHGHRRGPVQQSHIISQDALRLAENGIVLRNAGRGIHSFVSGGLFHLWHKRFHEESMANHFAGLVLPGCPHGKHADRVG
jgi:hypothetical protein